MAFVGIATPVSAAPLNGVLAPGSAAKQGADVQMAHGGQAVLVASRPFALPQICLAPATLHYGGYPLYRHWW